MNLPTYSLADSPHSTILNVCLGVPPHTDSVYSRLHSNPSSKPSSNLSLNNLTQTSKNRVVKPSSTAKGKAREIDDLIIINHHLSYQDDSKQLERQLEEIQLELEDQWENVQVRSRPSFSSDLTDLQRPGDRPPSQSSKLQSPPNSLTPSELDRLLNTHGWDESFATANKEGWAIYGTYPLKVIHRHVIPNGSLRFVVPLHRTNILYLVGGPPSPLYSPNKVIIYDSSISKAVFSIELTSPVLGLTARRDKLVVVLINRIYIFNISPPGIQEEGFWETCDNPKGLVCLGSNCGSTLLVFPAQQDGKVQVVHLPPFQPHQTSQFDPQALNHQSKKSQPPYPSTSIWVAHTTPLASLAVTPCGKLVATASVTGTLIRIWDAKSSALLRELRRGTDGAEIWGLRFRPDGLAICASSDKGTIHVWSLAEKIKNQNVKEEGKAGRPLALLKPFLPKYFHSTWSNAFFRLPPPGPPSTRALPSLFTGLPNSATRSSGSIGTSNLNIDQAELNKNPTIENDVSSVSWVLAPTETDGSIEPQIIVITRSGAWFRLRIPQPSPSRSTTDTSSENDLAQHQKSTKSVPNHHHHNASDRLGIGHDHSVELECVEYRRFAENEDWSDDEEE